MDSTQTGGRIATPREPRKSTKPGPRNTVSTFTKGLGGTIATAIASAGQSIGHTPGHWMVWASPTLALGLPKLFDVIAAYISRKSDAATFKPDDVHHAVMRERVVAMINTPGIPEQLKAELLETLTASDLAWAGKLLQRGLDS